MNDIKTSNAAAFEALPRGAVAVFVGGTSGIGQAMFELFVRSTTGKAVTAIVVGRNQKAAEESFAALRAESKEENDLPTLKFISCDVTLMKNVRKATKEILDSHSKIHILVVSQGYLTLDSRTPTEEGLDRKLAVDYYSRWVFIHELIPALEKARSEGEKATVTSVLGLGKPGKGPIDPDDFGVEKNYGVARIAVTVSSYQNYMLQAYAQRCPGIDFIHAYPGAARTPIIRRSNSTLLWAALPLIRLLTIFISVSAETCAEYMWHASLTKGVGLGWCRTGAKGEVIIDEKFTLDEEIVTKLWDHTVEVTKTAD